LGRKTQRQKTKDQRPKTQDFKTQDASPPVAQLLPPTLSDSWLSGR
jgi:hypothetical protein